MSSTVRPEEIEKFSQEAPRWWDESGPFAPLHRMNPTRLRYITETISNHFLDKGLSHLDILDVGCGGGLICEPLARLGANVTGLDASAQAIEVACAHAKTSNLSINYQQGTVETHEQTYDVVLALEIIEHVANVDAFITACTKLVKPGGLLILSTLNRTPKAFALGIVAAEYIARWVPRGTHNWRQFVKPSELAASLRKNSFDVVDLSGLVYSPFDGAFSLSDHDIDVNYFMSATKPA